ncbi:metal ABC transporter ATP-binding protein [Olsenella massiliensis]|uniref:metal ABC transporter ATP-binding protein n=1 Tax=Olsenella massiliensis TaxID=1622075 RepID=UPI0009EC401E|nr:metal ABC transporter ATP-binding protein [Olsenella massiliensis]
MRRPSEDQRRGHAHDADGTPALLSQVRFSYRGTEVLKGVDVRVDAGEICALVGDNGAGKSTIARLVVGELAPDAGIVRLFGENPTRFQDWERVGYVPQLPGEAVSRFPANVSELVDASQYASGRRLRRRERLERSAEALRLVRMQDFGRRLVSELSGGQLQRVRLACALVGDPCLLVLDEPTNGLDAESRQTFYDLLGAAHRERGMAILLVTHDLEALPLLGARVIHVDGGRAGGEAGADGGRAGDVACAPDLPGVVTEAGRNGGHRA